MGMPRDNETSEKSTFDSEMLFELAWYQTQLRQVSNIIGWNMFSDDESTYGKSLLSLDTHVRMSREVNFQPKSDRPKIRR
jgi:hypothetical protein